MAVEDFKRKLTAIFSADVAGYSRLMGEDEAATVKTLASYREVMASLIKQHRGRVVDSPGDNVLAEFVSVVDAVQCAVAVQKELKTRNADLPESRRMEFRIGVNLGDVIDEEDRIYGNGVNIAARLEALADPGGICISKTAFDQIETKLPLGYEFLGEQDVKNIAKPVGAYRVLMDAEAAGKVIGEAKPKTKQLRWAAVGAMAVLIIIAGALAIWNFYLRPPFEPASEERMAFPLPDKPSIAVLPFANMSEDKGQEYFSDGLTEEIISALSKVPKLFVIARNSTFIYKDKPVKVQQVSEELGVRYVLEGSVRKAEDRVRITAQLIDATTGRHLWSERYDRNLKDIFALQDEITKKIITALQVKLTEGEQARLFARGTENLVAYLKALEGQWYCLQTTKEGNRLARKLAEESIALDPKYASPYRVLGLTHTNDLWLGLSKSPRDSLVQAIKMAKKAIALDDSDAGLHAWLGYCLTMARRYDEGIAEGEKAVSLAPNAAAVLQLYATILTYAGRREEAIPLFREALRLNPKPPNVYYRHFGMALRDSGRYEEAIALQKKAIEQDPNDFFAYVVLTSSYSLAGRDTEAKAAAEEVIRINPRVSVAHIQKVSPHKDRAVAKRLGDALRKAGIPEHPPLPLPDKPSIAVLPFTNLSDDPKQEYFVDGMTDDLITDLSKISSLFVIARNSVFRYKGKPVDVKKVSRELGVRHVLEGSVRKAGNQVRINAQLIDASTGGHLWAERYDGKMDDVFALQDKITQKIVTALAVKLTGVEQEEVARKDTDNTAAYDALLKGYEYYFRGTVDDAVMAISYFEKAIELDQNYGRAYAALAKTYFRGPKIGREWYTKTGLRFQESMARARHYLEMANKRPTFTSHQIASLMALQRRQYKKALAEAELALSLEPNGVESNFSMGYILVFLGRAKEGIGYLKRSIELDPLRPGWALFYMGLAHFSMGQFDEAVELINRALTYNPKTLVMSGILAAVYAYLGRDEEARDRLQNYLRGFYRRPNLNAIMSDWPFKDPKVADRLAEGLIKAGLPGQASDYCKVIEENKLKGEEIRTLLFGRTINGWGTAAVKTVPWTIICTKDGRVEYMRSEFYDTGKSWIEGDSFFSQYETRFEGRKISSEVYRNPDGTPENMNEYFFIHDNGISPFSVKG